MQKTGPQRLGCRTLATAALVLLFGWAVPLAGCGGQERGGTPPATSGAPEPEAAEAPAAAEAISFAEAQQVFTSRCSSCHGPRGAGDGPAAVSLVPKPRNFRDASWQSEVTDEHIVQVISYGGAAVGKSAIMPGHPDLAIQPEVLAGLVNYIRSLKE